jgi:hypothetical protein
MPPGWKFASCFSSSSRDGKAQSMSSMRKIEFLGIEEAAASRKLSSTLYIFSIVSLSDTRWLVRTHK